MNLVDYVKYIESLIYKLCFAFLFTIDILFDRKIDWFDKGEEA